MADDLGNFVDGYTLALGNETDGRTLALGNSAGDLVDSPIINGLRYYEEVVDEELLAADECVAFHPLSETAGTQASDVSGKDNHGTYVDSPTLGEDPLSEGFLHSIGGTGQARIEVASGVVDISADFTIAFTISGGNNNEGVFYFGTGVSNRVDCFLINDNLRVFVGDGALQHNVNASDGFAASYCVRWESTAKRTTIWKDGVQDAQGTSAGLVLTSSTEGELRHSHAFPNSTIGFQDHGIFDAALTDAQCARLSEGTV